MRTIGRTFPKEKPAPKQEKPARKGKQGKESKGDA